MPETTNSCTLSPIATATVSSYLSTIQEGKDAETHLVALLTDKPTKAYLKLMDSAYKVIAELVCAVLGRAIGLFIPEPMLILVDASRLPDGSAFKGDGAFWAFASRQVSDDAISIDALIKRRQAEPMMRRWKDARRVMVFDEWIANEDRHAGNLVYSPEHQDIALIDHGRALVMSQWQLFGPQSPSISVANTLVDGLRLNHTEQLALRSIACDLMAGCQLIDFSTIPWPQFARVHPAINPKDVTSFLQQRIHFTVSLLCHRIGIPELPAISH